MALNQPCLAAMEAQARAQIEEAVSFAESSEFAAPDSVFDGIFAE